MAGSSKRNIHFGFTKPVTTLQNCEADWGCCCNFILKNVKLGVDLENLFVCIQFIRSMYVQYSLLLLMITTICVCIYI
mgnify:FL=1